MEDIDYFEAWDNEREVPSSRDNGWQTVSYSKRKTKTTQTHIQNDPGKGNRGKAESGISEKARLPKETKRNGDGNASEEDHEEPVKEEVEKVKQKKPKKPKKPKVSVVEAASAIDASDLAGFLVAISESYPTSPDVQLMRCTDYFGRAFNSVGNAQFGWNRILKESSVGKAIEIPLCYLSDVVKKVSLDWISTKPIEALGDFIIWALNDVLSDLKSQQKGSKTTAHPASGRTKVAVLVVLALVLRKIPDALVQKASFLRTDPNYQSLEKLPMLAWTYGQGDLVAGMYLWVQNLLPFSVGKVSTPVSRDITLQFVESLPYGKKEKGRQVLLNAVLWKGERLVPPSALDSLMRAAFPSDSTRTKSTERFAEIYPLLNEIALGGSPRAKATKPVALQLLPLCLTAASEDVEALYKEACRIMVWCLSQNTACYKQWGGLYLDNLKGSTRVLEYLCSEWQENVQNLAPLKDLKRTIKEFRSKNCNGGHNENYDQEIENLLKSAEKYCKTLQKKMSGGGMCKAIAWAIGITGIAFSIYKVKPDIDDWVWARILILKTQGS